MRRVGGGVDALAQQLVDAGTFQRLSEAKRPTGCSGDWFKRNDERKFRARPKFALHPDLPAHGAYQPACDGESQSHTLSLRFVLRQAKKIVENFNVILGRNSRSGVGHADLHRVGQGIVLPAPLAWNPRAVGVAAFPHVGLGVQPDRAAGGSELGGILQQVRDHPLQLGRIKRQLWQFLVGQKVERQTPSPENDATTAGRPRTGRD